MSIGAFLNSGSVLDLTKRRTITVQPVATSQPVAPPQPVLLPSPTVAPRQPIAPIPMTPPQLNPNAGVILPPTQPNGMIGSDAVINFGHFPVVTSPGDWRMANPPTITVSGAAPGIIRPVNIGSQDGGVITGPPTADGGGNASTAFVAPLSPAPAGALATKSVAATTSTQPSNMKVLLVLGVLTAFYFVIDGKRKH